MSLLRIRCSLADTSLICDWALLDPGRETQSGSGPLADLAPKVRETTRVQLLVPATQVLLTQATLPAGLKQNNGAALTYAVEELIVGDPEKQQVILLGGGDGEPSLLAVIDKAGYEFWLAALDRIGARDLEVHDEALLLPWRSGEWSISWDGCEGYLRSGERTAAAIDCGDRLAPPLALRLLLAEARDRGAALPTLVVHAIPDRPDTAPDTEAWSAALGVMVRLGAAWDWRRASPDAGLALEIRRRRWRLPALSLRPLRPALWMLGCAMLIHGLALIVDWSLLASERHRLRQEMESRFRGVFPDAVAVVDPALQMRRKLAEARHAAGASDEGDFLPMAEKVSLAMRETAATNLRILSYESGRMTLELANLDADGMQGLAARLARAGLRLDQEAGRAPARPGAGTATLTVRAL